MWVSHMRIQPYSFDSYSSSGSYSSTAANTKPAPYAYSTGPSASAHPERLASTPDIRRSPWRIPDVHPAHSGWKPGIRGGSGYPGVSRGMRKPRLVLMLVRVCRAVGALPAATACRPLHSLASSISKIEIVSQPDEYDGDDEGDGTKDADDATPAPPTTATTPGSPGKPGGFLPTYS